ncbi:MAG: MFS transporter [Deltaproteobacteria bacterium]|nr:MFS transporter [Deltaproteobacteria bacterium]
MKPSPFILLSTTGLFAIFSSTISKSPALPLFTTYLGGDPSMVGMVAAVSAFTGIVASIPAGILADRFGKKRMLVISALVYPDREIHGAGGLRSDNRHGGAESGDRV